MFGVGLEASVDYAMTTIDTSKVKDVKNILKLRQEVLKRDEERALVVGKVINQIFLTKKIFQKTLRVHWIFLHK